MRILFFIPTLLIITGCNDQENRISSIEKCEQQGCTISNSIYSKEINISEETVTLTNTGKLILTEKTK